MFKFGYCFKGCTKRSCSLLLPDFAPSVSTGWESRSFPATPSLALPCPASFPASKSQLELGLRWEVLTEAAHDWRESSPRAFLAVSSPAHFKAQRCSLEWEPPGGQPRAVCIHSSAPAAPHAWRGGDAQSVFTDRFLKERILTIGALLGC